MAFGADEPLSLKSPDTSLQLKVIALEGRGISYAISFRGKDVIPASPLGFSIDGTELTKGSISEKTKSYQVNENYPWRGVHSRVTNRCNGATISLKHTQSGTSWILEARAYDDGIAFRFVVPGDGRSRVPDESTHFALPPGSIVWHHDLQGHYEGVHIRSEAEKIEAGKWAAPPVTFKLPAGGGYASITEAALFNYSGMALEADGHGGFTLGLAHKHPVSYPFRLRYSAEDIERLSKPAAIS